MKKLYTLSLFLLVVLTSKGQINTPAGAAHPFGSNTSYSYGIMPTNLPTGGTYGGSNDAANAYNTWKTNYVRACGSQYRVLFDDGSSTVSEGIGYGMLLAAYAADKALFDGLWAYYKANADGSGLMNWKIGGCTGASGTGGATDADEDAAMALVVAACQWPTASSPYTYATEASSLITKIGNTEIVPGSYQPNNGDGWGFSNTCRNPSYFAPAYYRQFAGQVAAQTSLWNSAASSSYTVLNADVNTTTGLVSNWCDNNGTPNSCNGGNNAWYGYDACRNPWRMATDVLWYGTSAAQTNFCNKIAAYVQGKGATSVGGDISQSGGTGSHYPTFISTFAAGICGATSTYQTIMNQMYTETVAKSDNPPAYFGNTLRCIGLFVMSGNFWKPCGASGSPGLTVSITSPAAGANSNEGASVTINASASVTSGSITKVDFYANGTLIGTDNTSPYSFTWTPSAPGKYDLTAIVTDNGGQTTTSATVTINVLKTINQTGGTAPVIDGTVEAAWNNFTAANIANTNSGTVSSSADLSGTWKATWDNTNLYVLVNVTDDVKKNDSPSTNVYDDDGIEIYIDMGNTKTSTYGANQFQYSFRWNDATVYENKHSATTGVTFAKADPTGTSYVMEVKIPWSTLGASAPAINALEGFEVMVNDDDDGGIRDGKMAWAATVDNTWQDPSLMGTVIMLGATCTSPSAAGAITGSASVCSGQTGVTYTIASVTGATGYTWTVPTGAIITAGSGTTSITVTFGTTGGNVTVTPTNSCGNGMAASLAVTVNSSVAASVSIAASSNPACAGANITFTATAVNGGTTPAYQWKKNGTAIAGATASTYSSTALANSDAITCAMTSNASCVTGSPATSNTITMTVNPSVAASVSISASATTICAGTSVTFTATAVNGGTTPAYQWKKNGTAIAGATASTYSSTALANSDAIICAMTSNASCVTGSPATSNTITMTVNPSVAASVSISASATTICAGTSVTFTATAVNGGTTPAYQWKKNGTAIAGATASTYSTTTLANSDAITCAMTSNASCVTGSPATSNAITMTVNPSVAASVSISASATTICAGASVTFTATAVNGGTTPVYQWKKNGTAIAGATASTYSTTTLVNSNAITCAMTSNAACVTGSPATSNTVTMTVNPSVAASVSISASATTICAGTSVTFTATAVNGGTTPAYQWKKNGTAIAGATASTYSTTALANSDAITCAMTSNASCVTGSPATSNAVTMTVSQSPTAANAGPDQYITATTATLAGNMPATGTGNWSVMSGTGTFSNSGSPASTVNGLSTGANTLRWTISSGACPASTDDVVINVGTAPVSQTMTGPSSVTSNSSGVIYSIPNNAGSTYNWTVPAGATITSGQGTNTITVNFGTSGGTVGVTETNPYGSATSSTTVSVGNAPVAQTVSGPANIASGNAATYSVPNNAGSTYNWTVPAGATITSGQGTNTITVNFGTSGGTVGVTETNPYGSATSSASVSVGAAPVTNTITGPDSVGYNTTVTYSVPNNAGSTYNWAVPAGATIVSGQGTNTITVSYGSGGSGSVSVAETNPYGTATSGKNVSAGPAPTVGSVTGPTTVTAGQPVTYSVSANSNPNTSYNWTVPAGATIVSGQGTNTVTMIFASGTSGNIGVTETNGYGTGTASVPVTVTNATGINTASATTASCLVYPNPFTEELSLSVNTASTMKMMIRVIDMKGVVVYESDSYTNEKVQLGRNLSIGMYMIEAIYEGGVQIVKVNKE
jgi:endo-1,4-beta-D-glucanase Y